MIRRFVLRAPIVMVAIAVATTSHGLVGVAQTAPPRTSPIFRFSTDECWLSLHHFLYVLGRAQAGAADASREAVVRAPADADARLATLAPAEQQAWRDAVAFYAGGPSRKDAILDDPLPAVAGALAQAGDASSLAGVSIDAAWGTTLERVAPIYRAAWWHAHRAANQARAAEIQRLVDRHGSAVLASITAAYGMAWPAAGYPVHLSAYANWAGAYSTRGNLLIVSSLDAGTRGSLGLETVFHEGMHQWDSAVSRLLHEHGGRLGVQVPPLLSHAMVFFTAGDAVRRAIAGHVPYADAAGVWDRGLAPFKTPLEQTWKPYLDGRGSRDDTIAALVARTATGAR